MPHWRAAASEKCAVTPHERHLKNSEKPGSGFRRSPEMTAKCGRSLADVMASIDPAEPAERIAPPPRDIVPVNILVTPRDRKRLRQLSLDTGLSLQKLGHEAWNKLLESRGLEPLEAVTANVPSGRVRR
jgi:hypothetical protein